MQVPETICPQQPDNVSCGMYTILNLEHILERCETGLIWNTDQDAPDIQVPRPSSGLPDARSPEARAATRTWGAPQYNELWSPLGLFPHPQWFSVGDAKAWRALHRISLCLTWAELAGAPLRVQRADGPLELDEASKVLPPGLKGRHDKARCETAQTRVHACVGRPRAGGQGIDTE